MSYVRLKHTLSALALEMLSQAPRRRPIAWLLAYVRLAPRGEAVSLARLRREAARIGAAGPRALARLEALGLLEREAGAVRLTPAYSAHAGYLARQVARVWAALQAAGQAPGSDGATPLARGVVLFNAGLFFECHEYLEEVWRATMGPDRDFFHGIIQAAAAFYHYEKGNLHGARVLCAKAQRKLEPYRPAHLGVDVAGLSATLQAWRKRFGAGRSGRPLRPGERPRIRGAYATIRSGSEG